MKKTYSRLLALGLVLEVLIIGLSLYIAEDAAQAFKWAARYSGRLSALVFFTAAFHFFRHFTSGKPLDSTHTWIKVFAILHLIHFGFLASNIYLNNIPIIPVRLAGGALAYLLIILAPFKLQAWRGWMQTLYFFYVNLVILLTYLARVQGKFPGAETEDWHSFGLGMAGVYGLTLLILFIRSLRPLKTLD